MKTSCKNWMYPINIIGNCNGVNISIHSQGANNACAFYINSSSPYNINATGNAICYVAISTNTGTVIGSGSFPTANDDFANAISQIAPASIVAVAVQGSVSNFTINGIKALQSLGAQYTNVITPNTAWSFIGFKGTSYFYTVDVFPLDIRKQINGCPICKT